MIKELVAAAVLVLIAVGGIINVAHVDAQTQRLVEEIDLAQKSFSSGDVSIAEQSVQSAMEKWLSYERYNHIMLRHEDVDNVTEAFYELLNGLQTKTCSPALFESLCERLEKSNEVEHPGLSSIF